MNLYEIDHAIMDCVDAETGEIVDEQRLDELQMSRDTKIENIGLWIKNLLSDADAIKTEKLKLGERQSTAENKAASLKRYLEQYLSGQKFKSPRLAISYRRSEAVEIADVKQIPEEYLKYTDPTVDKTLIKAEIKTGKEVPGAALVEHQNIQIK